MRDHILRCDCDATALRVKKLKDYFSQHVLGGKEFLCLSKTECKSSHDGDFYEGQLHHVGACYDLTREGQPFRVALVGQEYGSAETLVDVDARSRDILVSGRKYRFVSADGFPGRNPHMRGCTSVLRLLFEKGLGNNFQCELLKFTDGEEKHIFECFALTNYLLCSALEVGARSKTGGSRGVATNAMWCNCSRHFREAIRILEPTVIIVQGKAIRGWIGSMFGLPPKPPENLIEEVKINGLSSHLVSFAHPSSVRENWGRNASTQYLCDVVKPTIEEFLGKIDQQK